jgi:hypothetical protein
MRIDVPFALLGTPRNTTSPMRTTFPGVTVLVSNPEPRSLTSATFPAMKLTESGVREVSRGRASFDTRETDAHAARANVPAVTKREALTQFLIKVSSARTQKRRT